MRQFENSEKESPKVLEIQNFNKINCFYDFLDLWPKFWGIFEFFYFFIYRPPYKNFWKKNLGPMSAGNETTVESRILLSYWSPRSLKTVNGRKLNFF